jgi:amino acid transporter
LHRYVGARVDTGTHSRNGAGTAVGRSRSTTGRPVGPWAFTGVAVASFGGPLALAALIAPAIVADAADSAGLAMLAAVVVFAAPLAIWLRYARYVHHSGGLFAFVEAAAGRRIALVQAGVWIFSYLLYVIYTTVQIVYDLLPEVVPISRPTQTVLALVIPVALAGVMIAGRLAALIVIGVIATSQLVLAGILDIVALSHVSTPASAFGAGAPGGELVKASGRTSLLYICGSLPLFLGGEVARPLRTIPRGLIGAFAATATVVVLAVAPLAAAPGLAHTEIPGMSLVEQFASHGLGVALGIGVAVSIGAVMLCEYLALTRLLHAIGSWGVHRIAIAIGALIVVVAPFTLIDPEGFYSSLIKPSLAALWVSQLIVFLVYPRFARSHRQRALPAWSLTIVASAFALYGLWMTFHQAAS